MSVKHSDAIVLSATGKKDITNFAFLVEFEYGAVIKTLGHSLNEEKIKY